jgi:hypothetical protein
VSEDGAVDGEAPNKLSAAGGGVFLSLLSCAVVLPLVSLGVGAFGGG